MATPLESVSFSDLPGWRVDDIDAAWPTFLRSAHAIVDGAPELRNAVPTHDALRSIARLALSVQAGDARKFVQQHFRPHRMAVEARGFVTAYYEPVVPGARRRTGNFTAPILARPKNLGRIDPYPDRRAILAGAIDTETEPVVWLRDAVEVFLIQVQGSARIELEDGTELRLVYDGRNGRLYTSIGRKLIEQGAIAPDDMSLPRLKAWLRENGAGNGGAADDVMAANESYVFFRAEPVRDPTEGPIGGQGVPLMVLRSIAVDRTVWSYGLPFWVATDAVAPDGEKISRLMIAQDTGSAIVGPSRADLFFGTGDTAGIAAGNVRHAADLFVLLPNAAT